MKSLLNLKGMNKPCCLLINPWIYDFAAHDFWAKPLGLLYIAAWLRKNNWKIYMIDCLNPHHPQMPFEPQVRSATRKHNGTGKFFRQIIPKPSFLSHVPRNYYRYGLTYRLFLKELSRIPKPDVILVTSGMTYWYPGVFAVINICKKMWPDVPVILGGIYATVCYEHAVEYSKADFVIKGPAEITLPSILEKMSYPKLECFSDSLYPAFDLLLPLDYVCILTSRGCPFHCAYCASNLLFPTFYQRSPEDVIKEILFWHQKFNIKEFAFYDDALLVNPEQHAIPLFKMLAERKMNANFHTPNGLHARFITSQIAKLMYQAGVRTVRLGLETASLKRYDQKLTREEFTQAVYYLLEAGFSPKQIGAYILIGLPEQNISEIEETITFVQKLGIIPRLAEYSPIPGTRLFKKAILNSEYDLINEPLTHNNSLLPCASKTFSFEVLNRLKRKIWHTSCI